MKILVKYFAAISLMYVTGSAMAAGALAIDGNQGRGYGFSYNYKSMGDAENRALQQCGRGCYIVKRFYSGCAAYAADQAYGSTAYGWGTSRNSNEAQNIALQYCRQAGGGRSNCIVRVWGCNSR